MQDGQESFNITIDSSVELAPSSSASLLRSLTPNSPQPSLKFSQTSTTMEGEWLSIQDDDKHTESLVSVKYDEPSLLSPTSRGGGSPKVIRGHWKSFFDGLQRVLVFTRDESILDCIKAADGVTQNSLDVSLTLKSVGLSLVDNKRRKEVAYIGITQ